MPLTSTTVEKRVGPREKLFADAAVQRKVVEVFKVLDQLEDI